MGGREGVSLMHWLVGWPEPPPQVTGHEGGVVLVWKCMKANRTVL